MSLTLIDPVLPVDFYPGQFERMSSLRCRSGMGQGFWPRIFQP